MLSAAMPGSQSAEATLPIVARYREAPARRAVADPFAALTPMIRPPSSLLRSFMSRSPFGGDVDDLFAPVRERELTLRSTAKSMQVLPLPTNGAPADFQRRGRPVRRARDADAERRRRVRAACSLQLTFSGRGNFDRVNVAGLPSTAEWKSYPPRVVPGGAARSAAPKSSSRRSCRNERPCRAADDRVQLLRSRSRRYVTRSRRR